MPSHDFSRRKQRRSPLTLRREQTEDYGRRPSPIAFTLPSPTAAPSGGEDGGTRLRTMDGGLRTVVLSDNDIPPRNAGGSTPAGSRASGRVPGTRSPPSSRRRASPTRRARSSGSRPSPR